MIVRFKEYLSFIDLKLHKMFEEQKEYICCEKGCAHCCKEGEYPLSELEYVYLMMCYNDLEKDIKSKIDKNIVNLLSSPREKMYACPFLLNGSCSVYQARPIICRTFGLITYDKNEKKNIPFCVSLGLNYSKVYNEETKMIESFETERGEPLAYNISRNTLRSSIVEKEFNLFFGEDKALIDWLAEDFKYDKA